MLRLRLTFSMIHTTAILRQAPQVEQLVRVTRQMDREVDFRGEMGFVVSSFGGAINE